MVKNSLILPLRRQSIRNLIKPTYNQVIKQQGSESHHASTIALRAKADRSTTHSGKILIFHLDINTRAIFSDVGEMTNFIDQYRV